MTEAPAAPVVAKPVLDLMGDAALKSALHDADARMRMLVVIEQSYVANDVDAAMSEHAAQRERSRRRRMEMEAQAMEMLEAKQWPQLSKVGWTQNAMPTKRDHTQIAIGKDGGSCY